MAETDARSTKQLFNEWRKGDGQAGQLMAQRFADWFYAISASRLGESRGSGPWHAACQKFREGAGNAKEAKDLVKWAHELVLQEVGAVGSRIMDGDEPNQYSGGRRPKDLLRLARAELRAEVALLEASYGGKADPAEIERLAAPLGGNPIGILRARYRVKQWLRDHQGVPFEVAPDSPVLDRAPLPLYESARMASPQEEINFEQWMISDIDLCRDIAEFAHFAIALRGGLPAGDAPTEASPAAASAPVAAGPSEAELEQLENNKGCLARLFGR
jgi:hypothetical protein